MSIKRDFFQAIGNLFGTTNQNATQINYNINMFSNNMDTSGQGYASGAQGNLDIIPHIHTYKPLDTYEIPVNNHLYGNDRTIFQRDTTVKHESRKASPMVIKHNQLFEDNLNSPMMVDNFETNYGINNPEAEGTLEEAQTNNYTTTQMKNNGDD